MCVCVFPSVLAWIGGESSTATPTRPAAPPKGGTPGEQGSTSAQQAPTTPAPTADDGAGRGDVELAPPPVPRREKREKMEELEELRALLAGLDIGPDSGSDNKGLAALTRGMDMRLPVPVPVRARVYRVTPICRHSTAWRLPNACSRRRYSLVRPVVALSLLCSAYHWRLCVVRCTK